MVIQALGPESQDPIGHMYDIDMEGKDWKTLTSRFRKAQAWISKRLQEKAKNRIGVWRRRSAM